MFDPHVNKAKMRLRDNRFFNFRKFVDIFQLFVYNFSKKPPPLKPLFSLPTWGQKFLFSEIEQIEKVNFDLGHPVHAY